MSRFIDITGEKYNKLKVISFYDITNNGSRWLCECDCGKQKVIAASQLKRGTTKSCGCLRSTKKYNDETKAFRKRLQYIYYQMKQRCYDKNNPAYNHYGARGINICEEWLNDINVFISWALENGYNRELTIERINVNGNYEPNNCKWITKTQQEYNKTNSVLYTINGATKCLSEWCKLYDKDYFLVRGRLKRGNSIEQALTKPIDVKKRNKLYKKG